MDIAAMFGVVTNPVGFLTGIVGENVLNGLVMGVGGLLAYQTYTIIRGVINPARYIGQLYGLADFVVLMLDRKIINKLLPRKVKQAVQEDIKKVLIKRAELIDMLIKEISD